MIGHLFHSAWQRRPDSPWQVISLGSDTIAQRCIHMYVSLGIAQHKSRMKNYAGLFPFRHRATLTKFGDDFEAAKEVKTAFCDHRVTRLEVTWLTPRRLDLHFLLVYPFLPLPFENVLFFLSVFRVHATYLLFCCILYYFYISLCLFPPSLSLHLSVSIILFLSLSFYLSLHLSLSHSLLVAVVENIRITIRTCQIK